MSRWGVRGETPPRDTERKRHPAHPPPRPIKSQRHLLQCKNPSQNPNPNQWAISTEHRRRLDQISATSFKFPTESALCHLQSDRFWIESEGFARIRGTIKRTDSIWASTLSRGSGISRSSLTSIMGSRHSPIVCWSSRERSSEGTASRSISTSCRSAKVDFLQFHLFCYISVFEKFVYLCRSYVDKIELRNQGFFFLKKKMKNDWEWWNYLNCYNRLNP